MRIRPFICEKIPESASFPIPSRNRSFPRNLPGFHPFPETYMCSMIGPFRRTFPESTLLQQTCLDIGSFVRPFPISALFNRHVTISALCMKLSRNQPLPQECKLLTQDRPYVGVSFVARRSLTLYTPCKQTYTLMCSADSVRAERKRLANKLR